MAKLCWKKSTRSGCWSLVNQLDSSIPTQIFPNWPTSVSPILVMTRPERPTMHWQSPKPLRCQDQIMSKLQGMSALIYRPRYSLISFVFTTKNKTEITQSSSRFTMLLKLSNVKSRPEFVEICKFYRHSDFTWKQILANSNGPKMSLFNNFRGSEFWF